MPEPARYRLQFLLAVLVGLLGWSSAVRAGDVARLEILGFSHNGAVFAFEEYGVQDGSGFPYANRYYIDTASDSFVKGTPIRVRLDDESATIDAARRGASEGRDDHRSKRARRQSRLHGRIQSGDGTFR